MAACSPECAAGGPLALVRTGATIRMSVSGRRLDLLVDPAEFARRSPASSPALETRGWFGLYHRHVL